MNDRESNTNGANGGGSGGGLPSRYGPVSEAASIAARAPVPPPANPRSRFNGPGILLAVIIAAVTLPFTYKFQSNRTGALTHKAWRMTGMDGITEKQAIARFGKPLVRHEFSLNAGSVMGPEIGQKKFVSLKAPDYEKQFDAADTVWRYPQYSTIRELIWKLPESYLTVWFHEPRAEVDLGKVGPDGQADIELPDAVAGDWVALDNYRLGNDLVREKKGTESPAARQP